MKLAVTIKPNSRKNEVCFEHNAFKIKIKAPATDGKANEGLIAFLSEILHLPKSKIKISKGLSSRIKLLEIEADETQVVSLLRQITSK